MTNSILPQSAVTIVNGAVRTTSLEIAKAFDKMHRNVCRDIEQIIPQVLDNSELLIFERFETTYRNNLGKDVKQRAYSLNKNAFMLLVMGFTGAKAMQIKICFINLFDRMERELIKLSQKMTQPELPLTDALPDMEKLFRMRHNGVPVIPTPDLAKAFGVSVNQLHGIRERNNKIFTETLDLFTVKGVTDNLICRILKAGYDIVPDCVSINLWTQAGARKLQMLLDGSRIKHKQLFCTEIIPAEKKEVPIAERKLPGKTRVKMLFSDIPTGLETETELGKLARAFAERDPEHGLAPYAEYIAYRTMFRKIRLIRQSVEKIDQCGADVSVLSDRSISGAMIL